MKLIIPDKFRGTLSAAEAARAISEGLGGDCLCLPMADGGEGTAAALPGFCVVESAAVIGHCSPISKQPILRRSSYNLGKAIRRALESDAEKVYVAVGGTATADCGAGMLQALGALFHDANGSRIFEALCPQTIRRIASVDLSPLQEIRGRLCLLSDVEASLCGLGLSALDFLRQKGASTKDAIIIKYALTHMQSLIGGESPYDGAGGGIGYALASAIGCEAYSGAEFVLDHLPVDWSRVELVATGEGSIDGQSLGGKVVGCILRKCEQMGIPAVAFGGRVAAEISDDRCVEVTPPTLGMPDHPTAYTLLTEAARQWAEKFSN